MRTIITLVALNVSLIAAAQVTTISTTANGSASTAIGLNTTASGDYSTAMGISTLASGTFSTAMGDTTTASGDTSTAMGRNTTASGDYSTAMGRNTEASGDYSTTMGYGTEASGDYSTTFGVISKAQGNTSAAMGYGTIASDYGSLVIGVNNLIGSTITSDANNLDLDNTAFVIGNGADAGNRSDALTVLFDGTTNVAGSVTATSFIGDGSQLTNLPSSSPFSLNDTSGTGIQTNNNTASGIYSTAMGDTTTASGYYSTAMGVETKASGGTSTAMGLKTIASGDYSTTMGLYTTASGWSSTAMGYDTEASGSYSTAMGNNTAASDYNSLVVGRYNLLGSTVTNNATDFSTDNTAFVIGNGADTDNRSDALTVLFDGTTNVAGSVTATSFIGDGSQLTNLTSSSPFSLNDTNGTGIQSNDNTASGNLSTAMGWLTEASGDISTAMGYDTTAIGIASTAMGVDTKASGVLSTAMGLSTIASDTSSLVIGEYNLLGSTVTNSATDFSTENTAFVIGNGADADNRSDALTVLFDGTTTIAGDLSINSDSRLKANIISLGSTLAKLLQIDGKTYTMKKDENKKQKIGVLAQDIEKVFPELVSESNGVKSVNYQGLVPVLINALKEQDSKMNEQEARIERLEKLLLGS